MKQYEIYNLLINTKFIIKTKTQHHRISLMAFKHETLGQRDALTEWTMVLMSIRGAGS